MKKLTAILLAVLTLTSCTADTEIDIAEGLETYREAYTEAGRETEVPYTPPEEIQTEDTTTQWGGIFSPDFTVSGGKYYFETTANNSTARTPYEAFKEALIPNDITTILNVMEEF